VEARCSAPALMAELSPAPKIDRLQAGEPYMAPVSQKQHAAHAPAY
jgi:hypothetical protein